MSVQQVSQSAGNHRPVFCDCYSTVIKAVDARYDIRGYLLVELVMLCLKNRATVPFALRDNYERYGQKEAIAYLEQFTAALLFGPNGRFSPHAYHYQANIDSL